MSDTAYQYAHYDQDISSGLIAGSSVLIAAMVAATGLRMVSQMKTWGKLGLDDYLLLVGLPINIALCVFNIEMAKHGLGKHQVRVNNEDPNVPSQLITIFVFGYLLSSMQPAAVLFIKLSLLVYYRRIFTGMQRAFRLAIWFNLGFVLLWWIPSQCAAIAHCKPINYFWYRSYAAVKVKPPPGVPTHGTCLNSQQLWIPILSLSILSDLMILFTPYLGLRGLQMTTKRKLAFLLLFGLGIFVCVAAGIRLYFTLAITNSGDISWSNAEAEIWLSVESCVGLVCACIPTFASLFTEAKRRRAQKSSQGYSSSNGWASDQPERVNKARSRHNTYNELEDDYIELVGDKGGSPGTHRATVSAKGVSPVSSRGEMNDLGHNGVGVKTDISVYT